VDSSLFLVTLFFSRPIAADAQKITPYHIGIILFFVTFFFPDPIAVDPRKIMDHPCRFENKKVADLANIAMSKRLKVYTHTHTHTHAHTLIYTHIHTHTHIHMYMYG